jgi:anti-sigma factor RsiW
VVGRIVDLLSSPHLASEALLPWMLNDTLTPAERRELEAHLQSCALCRDELARQRELMALYAASPVPEPETNSDVAFARLMERLQTDTAVAAMPSRAVSRAGTAARGRRTVFAVQMGVSIALGATFGWTFSQLQITASDDARGAYRGLAVSAAPGAGDAIIVFDPKASEADLRRVLQRAGARIVDGPTAANAYVVRFDGPAAERAIAVLRADSAVLRVETLSAGVR